MKNRNKILIIGYIILLCVSSASAQTTSWRLIWDQNSDPDMKYYKIYRDTTELPTTLYDTTNHPNSEYTDSNLDQNIEYFYRLKAVDSTELESDYSEQASAAIPKINFPDQVIYKNQEIVTINLNTRVNDRDDDNISWEASGSTNLNITIENNILTIFRIDTNFYDTEDITFTATDPRGFYDQEVVSFTFLNEIKVFSPVVGNIPDQTIPQNSTFAPIFLDNYVTDQDNTDIEIEWTFSGNTELAVSIDQNRTASITLPQADWIGSETITFTATDPDGSSDEDEATFTVTDQNLPPVVADIPDQTILLGQSFSDIDLDDFVRDPDNSDEEILWSVSGALNLNVDINQTTHTASIEPVDDEWTDTEAIIFIATDPEGLSDSDTATFTIENPQIQDQDQITAYPIPYRTNQGASHITFTHLPVGGELLIYDLLGYPVYKTEIISTEYPWRTQNQHGKWVRSGVYLYVVLNADGKKVKSDKVIIIR